MEINDIKFPELKEKRANEKIEGMVLLGCGGDLNEWLKGFSKTLQENHISISEEPTKIWDSAFKIITTGGRIDLILVFQKQNPLDMGKLPLFRLDFGDCSWISDYVVNYADQHGYDENGVRYNG